MSANGESDGTGCEPAGEVADGIAGAAPWPVACRIAALLAVDGAGLGGAVVAARHGPARARWLDLLVTNLPDGTPLVLTAPTIGDDRLLGGLDMAATLAARRPVLEAGAMARADGGLLLITGAERLPRATAARIAAALDQAGVAIHREGFTAWHPSRFGVVALDEGEPEAAACPASLSDRLAFHLTLDGIALADLTAADDIRALIVAARARLPAVVVPDEVLAALCEAAWRCAIASPRAALLAVRAARAVAALDGLDEVDAASAAEAVGTGFSKV